MTRVLEPGPMIFEGAVNSVAVDDRTRPRKAVRLRRDWIMSASGLEPGRAQVLAHSRSAALLDQFVFVSLLALTVLVAIPFGAVEPWWTSLYECAVFFLAALWIGQGLFTGSWGLGEW